MELNKIVISKEMAKQLKEVGFPQDTALVWWENEDMPEMLIQNGFYEKNINYLAAPTLEEILVKLPASLPEEMRAIKTLVNLTLEIEKCNGYYAVAYCGTDIFVQNENINNAAAEMYLKLHNLNLIVFEK